MSAAPARPARLASLDQCGLPYRGLAPAQRDHAAATYRAVRPHLLRLPHAQRPPAVHGLIHTVTERLQRVDTQLMLPARRQHNLQMVPALGLLPRPPACCPPAQCPGGLVHPPHRRERHRRLPCPRYPKRPHEAEFHTPETADALLVHLVGDPAKQESFNGCLLFKETLQPPEGPRSGPPSRRALISSRDEYVETACLMATAPGKEGAQLLPAESIVASADVGLGPDPRLTLNAKRARLAHHGHAHCRRYGRPPGRQSSYPDVAPNRLICLPP
jgi:hypothetical protein